MGILLSNQYLGLDSAAEEGSLGSVATVKTMASLGRARVKRSTEQIETQLSIAEETDSFCDHKIDSRMACCLPNVWVADITKQLQCILKSRR